MSYDCNDGHDFAPEDEAEARDELERSERWNGRRLIAVWLDEVAGFSPNVLRVVEEVRQMWGVSNLDRLEHLSDRLHERNR